MSSYDFDYIRRDYGVPADRGVRVVADGKPGTITAAGGGRLRIRLDGQRCATIWHPTWRIDYPATWLVWSHEHGMWWGPEWRGYRSDVAAAGRYDYAEALKICGARGSGAWRAENQPPEVAVQAPEPVRGDRATGRGLRAR